MLKEVYFVGYFNKKEEKIKFANMFPADKYNFLESSYSNAGGKYKYFPEMVYITSGQYRYLFDFKQITVTTRCRLAYKRDFLHFKGSLRNKLKMNKIKMIYLISLFSLHTYKKKNKNSSLLNIKNWVQHFRGLSNRYKERDEKLAYEIKHYLFKLQFVRGYKYINDILEKIDFKEKPLFVLWGKSYSSRVVLLDYLNKNDIEYLVAEYGEISGTFSCSPRGIFGETFTSESWKELNKNPLSDDDIDYAQYILYEMKSKQISTRTYDNNMFFLMKYFYDNSLKKDNKERQKIIYVNGSELFSSALYFKRWGIETHGKNPNQFLLEKVVEEFSSDEFMIVYKEHPMAITQTKKALLNPADFPSVHFLGNMNIHDVLNISDLVISYPSKVVITSLLYKKTIFVYGDFTIPLDVPKINYYTGKTLNKISKFNFVNTKFDDRLFNELVAKLIKYSLIIYDEELYYKYSREEEILKLKKIISNVQE